MQDFHHRWVRATYGVASAYVLADTYDKGVKQSKVMISSFVRVEYPNNHQ